MSRPCTIQHVLARVRTAIGLGRQQMASLLGISQSMLEKIERGERTLSTGLTELVYQGTGVAPMYLVRNDSTTEPYTVDGYPLTPEEFDRWRRWQDLTPASPKEREEYLRQHHQMGFGVRRYGPLLRDDDMPLEFANNLPI